VIDRVYAAVLAPAGVFGPPLFLLAAAAFGLATWCALALASRSSRTRDAARAVERRLPLLSAFASIAPLLGLLGTVHGLATTFWTLDGGAADVGSSLAGGVRQALVTSEIGLCVAIPTYLGHVALRRAARRAAALSERVR
jgi:biopolymer transport protein ExbB/TolQ